MKQVLVIGSDRTVRRAFESALDNVPCEVEFATDAAEGVEALRNGNFDLVFIDLQVPGFDGVGVLEWLRTAGNPVPVFVVTPSADSAVRPLRAAASKGFHYEPLREPFGSAEILAATTAVLAP